MARRHRLHLAPDSGPYFGTIDGDAVTSVSAIPVSDQSRSLIQMWWRSGYGDGDDPYPDRNDDGYESLTNDLAERLAAELGDEWVVTWEV